MLRPDEQVWVTGARSDSFSNNRRHSPSVAARDELLIVVVSSTPPPTAEQVAGQLVAKVPTAQLGQIITAENAPNRLLGRPGGYTSAATFTDSRVPDAGRNTVDPTAVENGGKVETFATADDAERRQKYIQGVQQAAGPIAGTEYSYATGTSLVRVTGGMTPTQAAEYEAALR